MDCTSYSDLVLISSYRSKEINEECSIAGYFYKICETRELRTKINGQYIKCDSVSFFRTVSQVNS